MSPSLLRTLQTIGLLIISNTFMAIAWYGHLKHKNTALFVAILTSWSIAFLSISFKFRLTVLVPRSSA